MGKKSGPPPPPDPRQVAQAEAEVNRIDTYSPSGSGVRFGFTNEQGEFQQGPAPTGRQAAQSFIESDTERELRLLNEQVAPGMARQIVADNAQLPAQARPQDTGYYANTLFNRGMSLLGPQLEQGRRRMDTNLQARGLPVGGAAHSEAIGNYEREMQDTMGRMAMDSVLAAGQEQSRQFGLDSQTRASSIGELAALLGGAYQPANVMPSGQAAPINVGGIVGQNYAGQMSAYNARQQQFGGMMGSLGMLGGALLLRCSEEIKQQWGYVDPESAARVIRDLPNMVWTYKDGEGPEDMQGRAHAGPMAEHFHAMTGLGEEKRVHVIDILAMLIGAVQYLINQDRMRLSASPKTIM